MITGDFLDYLSNAALELEVWGAPESRLNPNAAVLAAPVLGEPLLFEGASAPIEALAAESAPSAASAGPVKTITKKLTAEDAQKQVDDQRGAYERKLFSEKQARRGARHS